MWKLIAKNAKELWRDKKLLILTLFSPLFLLLLSHLFYQQTQTRLQDIPIDVVNPETGFPAVGKLITIALQHIPSPEHPRSLFAVKEVSRTAGLQDLNTGKTTALLVIPANLTQTLNNDKSGKLILLLNKSSWQSPIAASALQNFVEKFGFLIEKSKGKLQQEPLLLTISEMDSVHLNPELQSFVDVTLLAFLFLIPYIAGLWIGEIERGSFFRFRLAGISSLTLLAGTAATGILLTFTQSALLLAGAGVLGLNVNGLALWLWPVAAVMLLASYGLGLSIAAFLEKEKQLNLLAGFLLIPLYFFSGMMGGTGRQAAAFSDYLPWHQGYEALTQASRFQTPDVALLLKMLLGSVILASLGTALFSIKRFRHG